MKRQSGCENAFCVDTVKVSLLILVLFDPEARGDEPLESEPQPIPVTLCCIYKAGHTCHLQYSTI